MSFGTYCQPMKLYVSNIEESYKDIIIGNMVNSENLSLQLVHCWHACTFNEENKALTLVLFCSHMLFKYYSHLGLSQ